VRDEERERDEIEECLGERRNGRGKNRSSSTHLVCNTENEMKRGVVVWLVLVVEDAASEMTW
jgi:hypothetical protein